MNESEILGHALNCSIPIERAAFLDRACAGNTELRRRLEDLLAANARRGPRSVVTVDHISAEVPSEIGSAPVASAETTDQFGSAVTGDHTPGDITGTLDKLSAGRTRLATVGVGAVIAGRYTLVDEIGEGGMGTVYLADQTEPVKRQVALKLIRTGLDSRAVLARFDAERQALALMDHPNIARVYDGGTTTAGQPFFVMELVKGVPLTEFCDTRRLPIGERLKLFVSVCQAVQHAHQRGIIHRDLKPGNVLVTEVDGRATPKVIDFGLAKAIELRLTDMSLAETGIIVGTPAYMSPEQADPSSMDIDTRTDIYSLGVMLYELLVGSPPIDSRQFKRGALLEMLRMLREVDPPRPSTKLSATEDLPIIAANRSVEPGRLAKSLRGELDWVVMKALEKDRNRRYETATALARDLERYLADELVEARPPSARYRMRKFVRRHKGRVIAVSLVMLALVAGVIGTTFGMFEARRQEGLARQEWDRAEGEAKRAELNFATVRGLMVEMGGQLTQIELQRVNPKAADRARQITLDKARAQFDLFRSQRPDDEEILKQAAFLHRAAANAKRILGEFAESESANALAIQASEDLATRFPSNPEYRDELALTLMDRATVEKLRGKLKESASTLERARAIAEGLQDVLPDSSYRRTLGVIELDRSEVAYLLGQFEDSKRSAVRARKLLDQLRTAHSDQRQKTDSLFAAMAAKREAMALRELGKPVEALAVHNDATARMKGLAGPQSGQSERFVDCQARIEQARTSVIFPDRRVAAAADLVEVIKVNEKLVEDFPEVAFYREGLASACLRRGELLTLAGQPALAEGELIKSLTVSRTLLERHGALSATMLVRGETFLALARAQASLGKNDDAVKNWKNAVKVFEIARSRIDPDNFHHRRGLSEAERALKSPAQ